MSVRPSLIALVFLLVCAPIVCCLQNAKPKGSHLQENAAPELLFNSTNKLDTALSNEKAHLRETALTPTWKEIVKSKSLPKDTLQSLGGKEQVLASENPDMSKVKDEEKFRELKPAPSRKPEGASKPNLKLATQDDPFQGKEELPSVEDPFQEKEESELTVKDRRPDAASLAVDEDVFLSLDISKRSGDSVRVSGETNLLTGTKLWLLIRDNTKLRRMREAAVLDVQDGRFESESISLGGGKYLVSVGLKSDAFQPKEVSAFLARKRENLKESLNGNIIGVDATLEKDFSLGENPDVAQAARDKVWLQKKQQREKQAAAKRWREEKARRPASKRDRISLAIKLSNLNGLVAGIEIKDDTLIATVTDAWHFLPYQIRLQRAQQFWEAWATINKASRVDDSRLKVVDYQGNWIGGSRALGGSLIWVQEK